MPVVIAAKQLHIPVIIHESDMTPGLANKLSIPSASKVCCNFPETVKLLPEGKAVLTGSPIREELFTGKCEEDFVCVDLQKKNLYFLLLVEVLDLLRSTMRSAVTLMRYLKNTRSFICVDVIT